MKFLKIEKNRLKRAKTCWIFEVILNEFIKKFTTRLYTL